MKKFYPVALIFNIITISLSAASPSLASIGLYFEIDPELSYDLEDYGSGWIMGDQNGDGVYDWGVFLDEDGYKVYEVADYNKDGFMDDFYYYANDVLVRQQIDQNFDGRIDLWVYIVEGVYIQGYEQDSDFDGKIDVVKLYSED